MKKNILISTLGASWQIIPETLGAFFYDNQIDFYGKNPTEAVRDFRTNASKILGDEKLDELWLISTDQKAKEKPPTPSLKDMLTEIEQWIESYRLTPNLVIRVFVLHGVDDIKNKEQVAAFHNLALHILYNSKLYADGGKRIVSLACGRKTMSADIQDAAYCFGCDMMMHVTAAGDPKIVLDKEKCVLDEKEQNSIFPVVLKTFPASDLFNDWYSGEMVKDFYIQIDIPVAKRDEFVNGVVYMYQAPNDRRFLDKVEEKREAARHFYSSYWSNQQYTYDNFPILYTLSKKAQNALKEMYIGQFPENRAKELGLLQDLPKADLHCHLGGVLSVEEMIEVAGTIEPEIAALKRTNAKFSAWDCAVPSSTEKWKDWRCRIAKELEIHESYVVPAFILHYANSPEELEEIVYGKARNKGRDLRQEREFVSIAEREKIGKNIDAYESLGDLQGTSLLMHEKTLRKTLQVLFRNAQKNNLKYLEIRCSPINYSSAAFPKEKVLDCILDEMEVAERNVGIRLSLLFIASRHGDENKIYEAVKLYQCSKSNEKFQKFFRGFDVAGSEEKKKPGELRDAFNTVLNDCLNVTVHAGETMPVENIWQAVYDLNAERIGHGLTLVERMDDLAKKFRDRRIGIEMCPSSNYQIVGYKDNYFPEQTYSEYPLKRYMENHLRVCVNTDDPGISRTNITNELLKAARLTRGGLSLWDVFSLLYNSFDLAFLPYDNKIELLNDMNAEMKRWLDLNIRKIENGCIYEE